MGTHLVRTRIGRFAVGCLLFVAFVGSASANSTVWMQTGCQLNEQAQVSYSTFDATKTQVAWFSPQLGTYYGPVMSCITERCYYTMLGPKRQLGVSWTQFKVADNSWFTPVVTQRVCILP